MTESPNPPASPRPGSPTGPPPEETTGPSAPPPRDRERAWTVGEDGVVDEPGDRAAPRFDDDLDPADAP